MEQKGEKMFLVQAPTHTIAAKTLFFCFSYNKTIDLCPHRDGILYVEQYWVIFNTLLDTTEKLKVEG